jgi:hypothetical protein
MPISDSDHQIELFFMTQVFFPAGQISKLGPQSISIEDSPAHFVRLVGLRIRSNALYRREDRVI